MAIKFDNIRKEKLVLVQQWLSFTKPITIVTLTIK